MNRKSTAVKRAFVSPFYRGAILAMFLSGLGTSIATPQVVLFLVRDLGASLPLAALFYLTGLSAPVAGFLVGRQSDRTGRRMGLFKFCVTAGFLGWAGMAVSTQVWQPFVINAFVMAFAAASASQLFAALHDAQVKDQDPTNDTVTAIVRMALTAGWVIGPVLGAWIAAATSLRIAFWVTAATFLAQVLPLIGHADFPNTVAGERPVAPRLSLSALLPLLTFTLLFVLIYVGEPIKYGFLPIHMDENLGMSPAMRGTVIGIQPLVELLLMPFAVPLARRIGALPAMAFAAALAVCANICFGFWPSATGMFVGQILMGGVWGIVFVLGILVAQRRLPIAVATASAIFLNSPPLGSALGGVTGGLGVAVLGLPAVYVLPAAFAAASALGLVALARRDRMVL